MNKLTWRAAAGVTVLLVLGAFAVLAAAPDLAGTYQGEWSGASGAAGQLRVELEKNPEGEWKCVVVFTMDGEQYKTRMKSVKVDGAKLEAGYEFDMGGTALQSTLSGELQEGVLEGKYRTVTVSGATPVDEGVWKAKAKP